MVGAPLYRPRERVGRGARDVASHGIQGIDPELESLRVLDDLALSFGGNRVDLPVGVNFRLTDGPLAGQRFGVEAVWTAHEDVHGPRIASDWVLSLGLAGSLPVLSDCTY